MDPLNQPRDVPDAINILKLTRAQPQIHLLQLPPVARSKTFLDRVGDRRCLLQCLLAPRRLNHPLKKLRLLSAVELIESLEDCLAIRRQTRHLNDIALLALPLFRLAGFVQTPLPGFGRMPDMA